MKESKQAKAMQHTPGPWTAWDDDGTGTLPCVLANQVTSYGNFYVAQCNVSEDARLIAAAPDLLEACELAAYAEAEAGYGPGTPEQSTLSKECLAAISKAKGE